MQPIAMRSELRASDIRGRRIVGRGSSPSRWDTQPGEFPLSSFAGFRALGAQVQQNGSIFNPGAKRLHATRCAGTTHTVPGFKAQLPRMQRADDRGAGDDAIGQRAALVRATIFDGKEALSKIEDGNLAV